MSKKTQTEQSAVPAADNDPRRDLLKKLAIGGVAGAALPAQWSKPVIDSVMLPAHAQTTTGTVTGGGGGGGTGPGPSAGESLLDYFVSPAEAAVVSDYCATISIQAVAGVAQSILLTGLGFNACKPGNSYENEVGSPQAMNKSGNDWVTMVMGLELKLSNVNPAASKLADSTFDGLPGTINAGASCNFGGCFKEEE